jgi:hypothetical protein
MHAITLINGIALAALIVDGTSRSRVPLWMVAAIVPIPGIGIPVGLLTMIVRSGGFSALLILWAVASVSLIAANYYLIAPELKSRLKSMQSGVRTAASEAPDSR